LSETSRQFVLRSDARRHHRAPSPLLLWLSSLLLVALTGLGTARAAAIPPESANSVAPSASNEPGSQFAIADFDGDLRPDLASVQVGQSGAAASTYWIHLQFSMAGRQSISLIAPAGGLRIEALDVNGDHAIDLVLATAWGSQPVAVFLNDGHGSFSRAETGAFPEAFSRPAANWRNRPAQTADAVAFAPQSHTGIRPEGSTVSQALSHGDSVPRLRAGFVRSSFQTSHAGRAPPLVISRG
jgi:hypothetical protein